MTKTQRIRDLFNKAKDGLIEDKVTHLLIVRNGVRLLMSAYASPEDIIMFLEFLIKENPDALDIMRLMVETYKGVDNPYPRKKLN